MASESDIWLFDTEAGSFTDLTEDGLVGVWSYLVADGERVMLDYLPMWNPSDEQIYFWRIVPLGNMRFTIGLYRLAPYGGEAELVRDLTADFAAQVPFYDYERLFLDGISAISPDGNTVAVLMTSANDMGSTEQKAVDNRSGRCRGRAATAGDDRRLPQRSARMGAGLPAPGARSRLDRRWRRHRGRGQQRGRRHDAVPGLLLC